MRTIMRDRGPGWFCRLIRAEDGTYYVLLTEGASASAAPKATYSEAVAEFIETIARMKTKGDTR